jgi:hypothetical protein
MEYAHPRQHVQVLTMMLTPSPLTLYRVQTKAYPLLRVMVLQKVCPTACCHDTVHINTN